MSENEHEVTKKINYFLPMRYNEDSEEYEAEMYTNVSENIYMDFYSEETVNSAFSKLSSTVDDVKQEISEYDVAGLKNALNTLIYRLIAEGVIDDTGQEDYDLKDLQSTLNTLIYRLEAEGVIDDKGLDTVVILDNPEHITLIKGMYANKAVYI